MSNAPLLTDSPAVATSDPLLVLREIFGYPAFRGLQEAVVRRLIAGGDALVLMPTGGGKSLCYQVPALCLPGTAIVVSPLIALMQDQVAGLRQWGVAVGALHSEVEPDEARHTARELDAGRLKLLYLSPERLLMPGTMERLTRIPISLIAIDEAHCVSQWGHEFRPEYRGLDCLAERFPNAPRVALTATADHRTRDDILRALGLQTAEIFSASFHRTNLHLAAMPKIGETAQLQDVLRRHRGKTGIVYCGSRAKTERVAASLQGKGFPALAYHAGLSPTQKRDALRRFREGEAMVMVATIAFGMGIDRPDVRYVVHLDMPDSPEAYYQQIGRAGRDGEPSETLLLYGGEDLARARHFIGQSAAPEAERRAMRTRLEAMIALTEADSCRTRALLRCFGEELPDDCGHCDLCAAPPVTFDGTKHAQKVLSAIYRTGQIFGATHVTSVLRGEKTDAVIKHRHDTLSVFGIGQDGSQIFWRSIIRQLIAKGSVDVDTNGHGGLFLVENRARPILRGEESVRLREDAVRAPRVAAGTRRSETDQALTTPQLAAFEKLREWRSKEAQAQSIPAYVIFHDATLREIAIVAPRSLDQLGQIKGVGGSKLTRYGEPVLAALRG